MASPELPDTTGTCITIGNFDGLHLGHRALVEEAMRIAATEDLDFALMTFWPHPRDVLPTKRRHRPLTGRMQRMRLLASLGIERIIELPFTTGLAALSAEEFISSRLLPLNLKHLVVGHDFSLGRNREGDFETLCQLAGRMGFKVTRIPALYLAGAPVSSTRLREDIMAGNVRGASRLLGRFHSMEGTVVHGRHLGTGLGFPTANMHPSGTLLPPMGVYATFATIDSQKFFGMTNIGNNPTFGDVPVSVETFLLDANIDCYGKNLRLEFVERIRSEKKFSGPDELARQIEKDLEFGRRILQEAQTCPWF